MIKQEYLQLESCLECKRVENRRLLQQLQTNRKQEHSLQKGSKAEGEKVGNNIHT